MFACSLAALLGLAWFIYLPGLQGTFLFDDYANLPSLGEFGPVDNSLTFWRYLTSGSADPTGRPLALLSFLIDARNWPADPYPFKRTSVLLHLLIGGLLCWLLLKLGRFTQRSSAQVRFAALLGAALWLLHPLFVSTTLYVVQREAMLPALFTLLGLLGYCGARGLAAQGKPIGTVMCALSIGTGTVLGTLSKANGALLPLLAWIVECILLAPAVPISHARTRHGFVTMRRCMLVTPTILLFAFLAKTALDGFIDGLPAIRPWTLGERLLTESRILIDYLSLLWLPRPYTAGLFNDVFVVSTGLLTPPTTLLSLLVIIALLAWAWTQRRQHAVAALAILFFFAGQIIESTVVPLELYYEHRNYLPALLIFWPLALWLSGDARRAAGVAPTATVRPKIRYALAALLVSGLAGMTFLAADLWGSADEQALIWAMKNPESPRAQAYAAQVELDRDQVGPAIKRLSGALSRNPNEIQLSLNMVGAKCRADSLGPDDLERAATALRTAPNTGRLGFDWFDRSLAIARDGSCLALNLDALDTLLAAAGENPRTRDIPGRVQDRLHLQGRIALMRGLPERASVLFDEALAADPRPTAALQQAAVLATNGRPDLAQEHLDQLARLWRPPSGPGWSMPSIHTWLLWKQGYWSSEIARMRRLLTEDIEAQSTGGDEPAGSKPKE